MQLSIIIVSYNVKYFLEQCLCSVIKACKNIDAEIFVIDNDSKDGSRDFFSDRFPSVKFIWQIENAGFSKANNEGLKLASGKKILFLNPDTIVPEDCFEKCLDFFLKKNNAGAIGVKMIDGSGNYLPESKRGFPSSFTSFCKMSGLTNLLPNSKLFARYYLGHLDENVINEVDVLSGAFMMIDKNILEKCGGFDEDFFMYGEDIDLSYRIKKTGWKNYYFPNTSIIHFKGESTQKQSIQYIQNFYGAMILFVKKHYGKAQSIVYEKLIKIAIRLKGNNKNNKEQEERMEDASLICDPSVFEALKIYTQSYFTAVERKGRIKDVKTKAIVFCEPFVSFAEIIQLMQEKRNELHFFIHAEKTKSIIGSSNRNCKGVAIPLV